MIEDLQNDIDVINKRLDLMESVFKHLASIDMRLDTLEFNSDVNVKPAIGEKLLDMRLRLETLEEIINQPKPENQ